MKFVVYTFITSLYLLSCITMISAQDISKLESLHWMVGEWKLVHENRVITETWEKVSDSIYKGSSTTVSTETGKVISQESLLLVELSGEVFYIAKVPQNPYPVPFKLNILGNKTAIFENPEHDSPHTLEYTLIKDTTLDVYIRSGKDGRFSLEFKKQ